MGTPIDLDKMRSIGVLGNRTKDKVKQVYDDSGRVVGKDITDQLNNTVHVRDESQSVTVRPGSVNLKIGVN